MSSEYYKTQKACCVCQYWEGQREVSVNKNVRIETGVVNGICRNPKSGKNGRETPINYGVCPYFVKWDKLP